MANDPYPRLFERQEGVGRPIRRAVVDDDDLQFDVTLGQDRSKRASQEVDPVPGRNDDADLRQGSIQQRVPGTWLVSS